MAIDINAQVGAQGAADSTLIRPRAGKTGELIVRELHGRFYEQVYRGNVYSVGITSMLGLTGNTVTLTNTTTPILGIWNPLTSGVNAVVLQATLVDIINTATSVALGAFVWASSIGNAAISTGVVPWNRKTLLQGGSAMKGFAGATALTGLTNNLVIMEGAEFNTASGLLTTTVAAATP